MAKRRRLIPSLGPGPELPPGAGPEAALHPGLGFAAPPGGPPAASPVALPIAPVIVPAPAAAPPIARVAAEAAHEAAVRELSQTLQRARAEGRLLLSLPLDQVDSGYLMRDRLGLDEAELAPLLASLRAHGQRMPIEVAELGPGRYGLISGWRRLQALGRLAAEDPERFGQVQALLRRPAEASEAYVAMVEENEIRQGLSYYERARIAARAVDLGVFASEKQALQQLFAAASRARRSKIGSFLGVYRALDGALRFPAAIPERLGLALARALETAPEAALAELRGGLQDLAGDAAEEAALLARFAAGKPPRPVHAANPAAPATVGGRELLPGLSWQVARGGQGLVLSGERLTPALLTRLEDWLRRNA